MVQILADRFVEAFAECLHEKVRKEYWGYTKDENLTNEQIVKEEYKGIHLPRAIRLVPITLKK